MKGSSPRCMICREPYRPHPRNAKRNTNWGQKTCGKPECQQTWRRRRWQRWAKLNPDHIKSEGRRAKVRAWAKSYPNYWRGYYASHPRYVERDKLRRVEARRQAKLSAKQTAMRQVLVEKLRAMEALNPGEVSAKQTPILRRMDAMEDCLRSTVEALRSAKQSPIAPPSPSAR